MNKVKYNKYRDLWVILELNNKKHLVYSFFIALLVLSVFINVSSAAISDHTTEYGTMLYKQDMTDIREIVKYSDNSFDNIVNSESIDAVLDILVQDINGNPMADIDVGLFYYPHIYGDIIDSAITNENGIASFDVSTELIYGIDIEFGNNEYKCYGPIAIPSGNSPYTYTTFIYTLEDTESSIELRNINGAILANIGIEISLDDNITWTGTTDNNGIVIVSGLDDCMIYDIYFDLPETYCSNTNSISSGYERYHTFTATPHGIYMINGCNYWCSWFTVSPDLVYQPGTDTVLDYNTDLPYDELVYTIMDYSTIDDYNYKQSIHHTDQTDSTVHQPELPVGYYKIYGKIEHDDAILDIGFEDFWIYDSNSYPEYDISISYPSTAVDNNLVISIDVISNTGKIIGSLVKDNNEDNDDCCSEWGYCCGPGESFMDELYVQAEPYSNGYISLTMLLYDGPNVWYRVTDDVQAQNINEPVTLVLDVTYNTGTVNNPPIALFTYVPENPTVGQWIIFTASSSYDLDGNIVSYEWDFADGNNASGVSPVHTYSQTGLYNVTLTVTDNNSAINTTAATINIVDQTDLPIISIGSATGDINDTIILPITLANSTDIQQVSLKLVYDPEIVTVQDITANAEIPSSIVTFTINDGTAAIELTNPDIINVINTTPLIDIAFQTGENTGSTTLELQNVELIDDTGSHTPATIINGSITVCIKGDFNNNSRVDIGDVAKVAFMVAGKVTPDPRADFNNNGRVDIGDAAKIAFYLAGKVSEL